MANYEDYVKNLEGELENEIADAQDQQAHREEEAPEAENGFEVPERFKGKSPEEIARSYAELEKAYSRQGNDLGEMRKTLDEYIRLQSGVEASSNNTSSNDNHTNPNYTEADDKQVSVDDLYEDTEGSISRVVEKSAGSRIKNLEQEIAKARIERELETFEQEFPGWKDEVSTPEFSNWLAESPFRQRLAQAADGYDMDAARDLFSLYNEHKNISQSRRKSKANEQLDHASLESGGPEASEQPQKFSRRALMDKRIMAKRGDDDAAQWLIDNAESIAIAYEEGRVTD